MGEEAPRHYLLTPTCPLQILKLDLKIEVFGAEACQCVVFVAGPGLTGTHEEVKTLSPSQEEHCQSGSDTQGGVMGAHDNCLSALILTGTLPTGGSRNFGAPHAGSHWQRWRQGCPQTLCLSDAKLVRNS